VEVKTMPTMLEIWTEERKDGWIANAKAEMVLKALRRKFKMIPQGIEEAVLAKSDPIALESLMEHAIDSDTLDEFATALE
jgi:hypothetical protein